MIENMKTPFDNKVVPYSTAVKAENLYFISGQVPKDISTGKINGENIEEQTEQVMKNIGMILESLGLDFTDVAKTTCFLVNINDFDGFNKVYVKYFTGKPARSCYAVTALPGGPLCEVECIAVAE